MSGSLTWYIRNCGPNKHDSWISFRLGDYLACLRPHKLLHTTKRDKTLCGQCRAYYAFQNLLFVVENIQNSVIYVNSVIYIGKPS